MTHAYARVARIGEYLSTSRVKEVDAVQGPGMPNPPQYRDWRATLRTDCTAASGRGEKAFLWVVKAESNDASFDALHDSEGLDSLDAKLASALTKAAKG